MSESTRKPPSSLSVRLAVAQQARREAIYDARISHGDRPSSLPSLPAPGKLPSVRGPLPSVDELLGPEAPKARWKLVIAVGSALLGLGELARQVASLLGKH